MKKTFFALTLSFIIGFTLSNNVQAHSNVTPAEVAPQAVSHAIFDGLLKKYVTSSGKVNYAGFKTDKAKLKKYLDLLKANPPKSSWSRDEQIAYWINAYNAHTINLVIQQYPVSSILKIKGGKVWTAVKLSVGGKSITLSDIEKKVLIGKYKESRIHFAINCAAKSCPPLMNKAWKGSTLNLDLNKQTKAFINNQKFNRVSSSSVKLSKIFEWYAKDFGDVKTYINKYSVVKASSKAKITYNEYDWSLNK